MDSSTKYCMFSQIQDQEELIPLKAASLEAAFQEVEMRLVNDEPDEYDPDSDEFLPDQVLIIPTEHIVVFDVVGFVERRRLLKRKADAKKQQAKELEEYERLKKKYGL